MVQAAAAKTLTVTGLPTTVTAGTAYNITVTAYDAYGNVATGYTGTVAFSSTRREGRPAGQLRLRHIQRRDAYVLRHVRDGGDAIDHRDRHDDVEHYGDAPAQR